MVDGTQRVRVNGLDFSCRLDGPEGAPWLVFSNSLLTDMRLWDPQVDAFAAGHRILRYDKRGHGGTEVPDAPASIRQLADDAAALMAHFGVERATFVGDSIGAATAMLLAARAEPRVAAVVPVDGQPASPPNGAQMWQERIDLAAREGMSAFAEVTLRRWFAPESFVQGNPAIGRVRAMIEATPEAGFVACARALQSYDIREDLPGIAVPVLMVAGAADGAIPGIMRGLTGVIPGSRFVELPGAGHLPGIEAPGPFNAVLGSFLEERAAV
ncbi:alpha/beta fold hydrolase [Muricoccus vinaceus]|uniref:Alpha/beta fold hydrolase n=1 Tax=Muricoccus vinaceus TaxID=424704 RepID=A0ABV6IPX1_9PROT